MKSAEIYTEYNKKTQKDEYLFVCEIDDKRYLYSPGKDLNVKSMMEWINKCLKHIIEVSSTKSTMPLNRPEKAVDAFK